MGKMGKTKKGGTYKKRIYRKRVNRRRTHRKQTGGEDGEKEANITNIVFSQYPPTKVDLTQQQMDGAFTKQKQITIYAVEIKYHNATGWNVHTDDDDLKNINRQFSEIFNTYDSSTKSLTEGHIWTKEGKFLGNRLIVEPYYDNQSGDISNLVALNFYHTDKDGIKTLIRNVTDDQGKTTDKPHSYPLKPNTILEFYHVKPGENRLTLTQIKITYERPPRPLGQD